MVVLVVVAVVIAVVFVVAVVLHAAVVAAAASLASPASLTISAAVLLLITTAVGSGHRANQQGGGRECKDDCLDEHFMAKVINECDLKGI